MPSTEGPKRTRYFAGRTLTAEDFSREQEYVRERQRRHNRALHGWGVVSGLDVEARPPKRPGGSVIVTVSPGLALTALGDEIALEAPQSLPLPATRGRWLVAARYDERLVDPMPVAGAPSDDTPIEFGAVEETFALEIVDSAPDALDGRWVVLAELERGPGRHVAVDTGIRRRARLCAGD